MVVLPPLTQPSFLANDPFAAYMLSLTDPASIAQAALTRAASQVQVGTAGTTIRLTTAATAALAAAALETASQVPAKAAVAMATTATPANRVTLAQTAAVAAAGTLGGLPLRTPT